MTAWHPERNASDMATAASFAKCRVTTGHTLRDAPTVTRQAVTSGFTAAICDRVALGLKLEVTHGPHWLRTR